MGIPQDNNQDSYAKFQEFLDAGLPDEAASFMSDKLNDNFDDIQALYGLAHCYKEAERWGHAFNLYRTVAGLTNGQADALNGMGLCFQESWDLEAAEKCFRMALKKDSKHPHALNNLGLIKLYQCLPEESLKWFSRALDQDPHMEGAILNRAYAHLMVKNWEKGWKDWVRILGKTKTRQARVYEVNGDYLPRWKGEKGKTVLVYGEQGIGDELSFASCIPDLQKECEVIIDCDHRLKNLFERSFWVPCYGTRFLGDPSDWVLNQKIDACCAIGDLPAFYRNSNESFPGTPYLSADPERRLQWKALLDSYGKPKIGIAWNGGTKMNNAVARSMSLDDLSPVLRCIDATWVSLEYKDRQEEIDRFTEKTGVVIHNWPRATRSNQKDPYSDYDDTASLVAELDLVITVTTAVVHLSGALGKDCWCIAPERPRWFYGLDGDLPWYKSVKMFRKSGEWPIKEICNLLKLRFLK